jgi:hypothetical protein
LKEARRRQRASAGLRSPDQTVQLRTATWAQRRWYE